MPICIARIVCRLTVPDTFSKDPLASKLANEVALFYGVFEQSPMVVTMDNCAVLMFEAKGTTDLPSLETKILNVINKLKG